MSACTPKYSCAPPSARRKPTNTSSKISTMPRSVQTARSRLQPVAHRRPCRNARARELSTSDESAGAPAFGCSACSGLTSTQAMSRRVRSTLQRILRHVLQRVGLVRRHRVADAGLHVAPPAVIGAAEAHHVGAAGVIAREPHRLHHRLGAGHVERHFVEAGDFRQPRDVLGDHRMIAAEHRAELADALLAALQAALVEVVAEDVDAVGAGQVVEAGCRRGRSAVTPDDDCTNEPVLRCWRTKRLNWNGTR